MPTEDKILGMMEIYDCDRAEATIRAQMYELGLEDGRSKGRVEAQRTLRVALGIENPEDGEQAFWQDPVPTQVFYKGVIK